MQQMLIEKMKQSQNGMSPPQTGPREAHDRAHRPCPFLAMTTNLAIDTDLFRLAKRAKIEPIMAMTQQFRALATQALARLAGLVMGTAIEGDHCLNGAFLATNARPLVSWPMAPLAAPWHLAPGRRIGALDAAARPIPARSGSGMSIDRLPVALLIHDPIMRAKGDSRQVRGLQETRRPTRLPAHRSGIARGRSISGLGLIAALLLGGCAHQPYPDLDEPDPLAQDLPKFENSASGSTLPPASSQSDTASASESPAEGENIAQAPEKAKLPDPPDPGTLPPAKHRRIEIKLKDQRFDYYEDNQMLWSGPISSGTRRHPTPRGRFRVQSKDIDKRSGSYTNYFNQPTPMPYSLQFHGPYFIHEGYLPDKPASHGCVRLRYEDAKFIFERMHVGDRVIVSS